MEPSTWPLSHLKYVVRLRCTPIDAPRARKLSLIAAKAGLTSVRCQPYLSTWEWPIQSCIACPTLTTPRCEDTTCTSTSVPLPILLSTLHISNLPIRYIVPPNTISNERKERRNRTEAIMHGADCPKCGASSDGGKTCSSCGAVSLFSSSS